MYKGGGEGERVAAAYLENLGYRIISRNWRSRSGEIDIIAFEKETLCFVEVKSRRTDDFGTPASAVGPVKQKRLIRLAEIYISLNPIDYDSIRFDVVEVTPTENNLIRDAFRRD